MRTQRAEESFGCRNSARVTLGESIKIMQRYCRVGPDLMQTAAEHTADMVKVLDQLSRSGEERAGGRIEALV